MTYIMTLANASGLPASFWHAVCNWDASWKIHPILVNFTVALLPKSLLSDFLG
jgi:hypothetical protein